MKKSPRDTILLNIDQEWYKQDPPVNFTEYKNPYFDTTIHAGLIHNNWKLLTGDPGHFGFYKNKTTTPNPFPSVHLFDLDSDPLGRFHKCSKIIFSLRRKNIKNCLIFDEEN